MQFLDNKNRPWQLEIDAPTIEMVRAQTCPLGTECKHDPRKGCQGVDLADVTGKAMTQMAEDPLLLVRVLTLICTEQLQAANVDTVDFAKSLVGDAIGRASDAMLESIAGFFHGAKRELVKAMADKTKRVTDLGIAEAMEKVNDPQTESRLLKAMRDRMEATLQKSLTQFESATSSPESSG